MAKAGRLLNTDEGPIENEIPDPPPEDDTKLTASTGGSVRLAMNFIQPTTVEGDILVSPTMMKDEIPDPPPEDDTK